MRLPRSAICSPAILDQLALLDQPSGHCCSCAIVHADNAPRQKKAPMRDPGQIASIGDLGGRVMNNTRETHAWMGQRPLINGNRARSIGPWDNARPVRQRVLADGPVWGEFSVVTRSDIHTSSRTDLAWNLAITLCRWAFIVRSVVLSS